MGSAVSRGDLPAASSLAASDTRSGRTRGQSRCSGSRPCGRGYDRYFGGDLSGAEEHFLAGAGMFADRWRKISAATWPSGFGFGSHVAWMLGHADTARDRIHRAIAGAEDLKSPFELAYAQFLGGDLHLFMREFAERKNLRDKVHRVYQTSTDIRQYSAGSRVFLGSRRPPSAIQTEGIPVIYLGLDGVNESGAVVAMSLFLSWLRWRSRSMAKYPDALAYDRESTTSKPSRSRLEARRHKDPRGTELGLRQTDGAESDFRDAISLAQKIGAKAWELRAAMSLVRMLIRRGDLAEARDLLTPALRELHRGLRHRRSERCQGPTRRARPLSSSLSSAVGS